MDILPNKRKGKALFTRTYPVDKTNQAYAFCKQYKLTLEIINRLTDQPITTIPHHEFLHKLTQVEYYLDLKGLTSPTVLSVSGIEALERGCKVLVDTGEIITDFQTTRFQEYINLYKALLQRDSR
jgi:hypothetical protein